MNAKLVKRRTISDLVHKEATSGSSCWDGIVVNGKSALSRGHCSCSCVGGLNCVESRIESFRDGFP